MRSENRLSSPVLVSSAGPTRRRDCWVRMASVVVLPLAIYLALPPRCSGGCLPIARAGLLSVICAAHESPAAEDECDHGGFLGVLFPRRSMNISPRFEGTLEDVYVEIGDCVEPDQVLAKLDTFLIERDLETAEKLLEVANRELSRAERQCEYAQWKYRLLSRFERENPEERPFAEVELKEAELETDLARQVVEIAKATIEQENARIEQLRRRLRNATMRAPFSGVVAACYSERGATVSRGAPLVRLVSADDLWVRFAVGEEQVACIEAGAIVRVDIDVLERDVTGSVRHIAPEVDPALGIMLVEAKLNDYKELLGKLKPGMVAHVHVEGATAESPMADDEPDAAAHR